MIETSVLAGILQDGLNANSDNIAFKIFADDGQFQKAIRNVNTITKYVNGVYTIISSDLLPFKALNMYSITATLDLVVDVENAGKDANGNYIQVEKVKKVLNNYGNANNGQIFTIDGLDYQISAVYNFATVGTQQVLSPLGRCIPIQMWIRYQFVENGVNSNSANLYINGENIPFNTCSISRVRTVTNNNFTKQTVTKATCEQNGISIDVKMPLLSTTLSRKLTKDVLNGGNNNAVLVGVEYNSESKVYLMTIGNNSSSFEINKNVGQDFSLIEVAEMVANTDDIQTAVTSTQNYTLTNSTATVKKCFVIWGDGNTEIVTRTDFQNDFIITHTYSTAGTYKIYYIFA